jgi:hypothetical protein
VTQGDIFQLDLVATNVQLGAYDLTFQYNPLLVLIDPDLVMFDTHLGGPDGSFTFAIGGLDTLETVEVSFLTSATDLAALQTGASYPLAHIQVKALAPGTAVFDFVTTPYTDVSNYSGTQLTGLAYQAASVTILAAAEPPPPPPSGEVPEPSSTILLVSGAGFVLVSRLRRMRT